MEQGSREAQTAATVETRSIEDTGLHNIFLSEFPHGSRWVRWIFLTGGWVPGILFLVVGSGCVVLARLAGAACMSVVVDAVGAAQTVRFGFVHELNAGIFYVTMVPVFGFAVPYLLYKADVAIHHLQLAGRLKTIEYDKEADSATPAVVIEQRNRFIFHRWIWLPLLLVPFCIVFFEELSSLNKLSPGWVQALVVPNLENQPITKTGFTDLPFLQAQQSCTTGSSCVDGLRPVYPKLESIFLSRVNGGARTEKQRTCFWVLLLLHLLSESTFISMAVWTACKLVFFLSQIFEGFAYGPGSQYLEFAKVIFHREPHLCLSLDFDAEDNRFGLSLLDHVYSAGLLIGAVLAAGMFFQKLTNVAKGTVVGSDQTLFLGGQVLTDIGAPIIPALIILIPACGFFLLTDRAKDQEISRRLAQQLSVTSVQKQAPFPAGSKPFWTLLLLVLFFLAPLLLTDLPNNPVGKAIVDGFQTLAEHLCH